MEPYIKLLWSCIYNRIDTLKLMKSTLDAERTALERQLNEFNLDSGTVYILPTSEIKDRNEAILAAQELINTFTEMSKKVEDLMDLSEEENEEDVPPHKWLFDHDDPYFWK